MNRKTDKQLMFEEGRTTYADEVLLPAQHSKNAVEVLESSKIIEVEQK